MRLWLLWQLVKITRKRLWISVGGRAALLIVVAQIKEGQVNAVIHNSSSI